KLTVLLRECFPGIDGSLPIYHQKAGTDTRDVEVVAAGEDGKRTGRTVGIVEPREVSFLNMFPSVHSESNCLCLLVPCSVDVHVLCALIELLQCFSFDFEYFLEC